MGRRRKTPPRRQTPPPAPQTTPPPSPAPKPPPRPTPQARAPEVAPADAGGRWAWVPVLALAVLLRAIYYLEHRTSPFFSGLVLDAANYDALGWRLASGEGFGEDVFTYNPLAPVILAGIYAIGGHDLAWPRLVLLAVDALTALSAYALGRAVGGWRAGLAAGLLAAAYGPAIFYAGELLAEGWVLAAATGGLALLLGAGAGRGQRLAAGLLLGVAALGRPNLLLFFPALLLGWLWQTRRLAPVARQAAPLLLGVALVLAPFTLRNAVVGGDRVLVTAHGGVNLFLGNNKDASGWFGVPKGTGLSASQEGLIESATLIAEQEAGRTLRPSEVSRHWQREAVRFWTSRPFTALGLTLRKTGYLLNAYEKPMVANYHYEKERSVALRWLTVGYGLVLTLGLAGMVIAWPRRRELMPLYLFCLTYALGVILFFVSMRYRLPLVAGLLPFAGITVERAWVLLRRDPGRLLVEAVLVAGLGLLVGWPSVRRAELPGDMAHTHYYLGGLAMDAGDAEQAVASFEAALQAEPGNVRYRYRLARAWLEVGRTDEAIASLRQINAEEPIFLPPYLTLGMAYRDQNKLAEAEGAYRAALKVSPRYHMAWNNLGNVLLDQGRGEEAVAAFAEAVRLEPVFLTAYQNIVRAYSTLGRPGEARPYLEAAKAAGLQHPWVDEALAGLP